LQPANFAASTAICSEVKQHANGQNKRLDGMEKKREMLAVLRKQRTQVTIDA